MLATENLLLADLPLLGLSTLGFAVVTAVLLGLRRLITAPQMKDFFGISATFVVLAWFGWLMIVGEHALG